MSKTREPIASERVEAMGQAMEATGFHRLP